LYNSIYAIVPGKLISIYSWGKTPILIRVDQCYFYPAMRNSIFTVGNIGDFTNYKMASSFFAILLLTLVSTLVTSNLFVYPSIAAYSLFTVTVGLLILFSGILLLQDNKLSMQLGWFSIFFGLWVFYIFLQKTVIGSIDIWTTYMGLCFLSFVTLTIFFSHFDAFVKRTLNAISIVAVYVSIVCILQSTGIVQGGNPLIRVTGTYSNPNISAMFLAMASCANVGLVLKSMGRRCLIYLSIQVVVLTAIILLHCRTAGLGLCAGVLVQLDHHYMLLKRFSNIKNRIIKTLVVVGVVFVLSVLLYVSYNSKKNSADGRALIWKIEAQMFTNRILTGYGYGSFDRNYNLAQAEYFRDKRGGLAEQRNAGYVHSGYNEFLQNAMEGGIVGAVFFFGFMFCLLCIPFANKWFPKNNIDKHAQVAGSNYNNVSYSGVVCFTLMSFVNFTIQAIPVFFVFIILLTIAPVRFYSVTRCTPKIPLAERITHLVSKGRVVVAATLIIIGFVIFVRQFKLMQGHLQNKKAADFVANHQFKAAEKIFFQNRTILKTAESYWRNMAIYFVARKNYNAAIRMFAKAKEYASDPDLFYLTGNCYLNLKIYKKAEFEYAVAANIEPNILRPRFALMKLYSLQNDTANILKMAHNITAIQPKVISDKAIEYKKIASYMIKKYSTMPISTSILTFNQIIQ
jgi:O-antigen polymerase